MATIMVPVDRVNYPWYLQYWAYRDQTDPDRASVEVYTGWIFFEHNVEGDTAEAQEIVSFVPHRQNSVHIYPEGARVETTVTASVCAVRDFSDEENIFNIENARVLLEKQSLPRAKDGSLCLILRARIIAGKSAIHGISYQVTVLSDPPRSHSGTLVHPEKAPQLPHGFIPERTRIDY